MRRIVNRSLVQLKFGQAVGKVYGDEIVAAFHEAMGEVVVHWQYNHGVRVINVRIEEGVG